MGRFFMGCKWLMVPVLRGFPPVWGLTRILPNRAFSAGIERGLKKVCLARGHSVGG